MIWQPRTQLPGELEAIDANRRASALLGLLGGLDELPPVDDSPQLAAHVQRLDQKLDLALELLGRLVAREQALPAPVPVQLSARAVMWRAEPPPAAGSGWVALYLLPHLPKPLELPAVLHVLDDGAVVAEFQGLEPAVSEALERFVFRCHRRAVAQARRPGGAG